MKRRYLPIILIGFTAVLLSGCGVYSFSPSGKPDFESVYINQFETTTIEFQLADRLSEQVIDAFIEDNTVKIRDKSQAEADLQGSVTGYKRDPYTYDKSDQVTEYVVKVNIHVKVAKTGTEDIYWEEDFYAEGVYKADSETEEEGQDRAIAILAADILDRTTKSW